MHHSVNTARDFITFICHYGMKRTFSLIPQLLTQFLQRLFFFFNNCIRIVALVTFLVTTHSSIDIGMCFISINFIKQGLMLQANGCLASQKSLSVTERFKICSVTVRIQRKQLTIIFDFLFYLNLAICLQVDNADYEKLCSCSGGALDQSPCTMLKSCQLLCMVFYDCSIELGVDMLFTIVISSEKNVEHCYFYSELSMYTIFFFVELVALLIEKV